MENPVTERFKELIRATSDSATAFSSEIGVSQSTLSCQLNSKKGVSSDVIFAALQRFPEISAEWLFRGKGDLFLPLFTEETIPRTDVDQSQYIDFEKVFSKTSEEIENLKKQIFELKDKIKEQIGCIEWQKGFISDLVVENHELEKKLPNEAKKDIV